MAPTPPRERLHATSPARPCDSWLGSGEWQSKAKWWTYQEGRSGSTSAPSENGGHFEVGINCARHGVGSGDWESRIWMANREVAEVFREHAGADRRQRNICLSGFLSIAAGTHSGGWPNKNFLREGRKSAVSPAGPGRRRIEAVLVLRPTHRQNEVSFCIRQASSEAFERTECRVRRPCTRCEKAASLQAGDGASCFTDNG